MKIVIVSILLLASPFVKVFTQSISISPDGSPPDSSAILDIQSTSKGLLIPRMTQEQRDSIILPVLGLTIFQTDGIPGMYYYDGIAWTPVGASIPVGNWPQNGDDIYNSNSGNIGIGTSIPEGKLHIKGSVDASEFIIDASEAQSNTNPLIRLRKSDGTDLISIHSDNPTNIFFGNNVGKFNMGVDNTFIGDQSGSVNTIGSYNTAIGAETLLANTTGSYNTAHGYHALWINSTACRNTAIGNFALHFQSYNPGTTWNSDNVAVGYGALALNQPTSTNNGIGNTGVGSYALTANTTGWDNTAIGTSALYSNTVGVENTAVGRQALFYNTYPSNNTAMGFKALRNNSTGQQNTALGSYALISNNGSNNVAIGFYTLAGNTSGFNNVAIGDQALGYNISGNYNVAVGKESGTSFSGSDVINSVSIGNHGYLNAASNQDFIGNLSTAWIGGQTTWYTYASDARVKNHVQEDVKGLDFISRLRPVTYNLDITSMREITGNSDTDDYPEKYDIEKIKQSGFLAQEVEQAALASGYNFNGITIPKSDKELYTMSYSLFVVPLVKAVQELSAENTQLKEALQKISTENEILSQRMDKIESIITHKGD